MMGECNLRLNVSVGLEGLIGAKRWLMFSFGVVVAMKRGKAQAASCCWEGWD